MSRWICSQIGAREHYAIPRALQISERLDRVFTDLHRPGLESIPSNRVTKFPIGGAKWWWQLRSGGGHELFIEQGKWFSEAILAKLERDDVTETTFFGYDTGFLEAATHLKERGAKAVVGQIDPGRFEFDLVEQERLRWPGWENSPHIPEGYHWRREQEWEVADQIIVNSEWSRDALIEQGVADKKIEVIPLCYEAPSEPSAPRRGVPGNTLEILWLGQVNLRKGIPYLIEAARKLPSGRFRFTVAGPITVEPKAVASLPSNVEFVGPVSRSRVSRLYAKAHVFILPTLSDGFAITQLEAMAHGLPVVTTRCCGKVVNDGVNGFLIEPRRVDQIVDRLVEIYENPSRWEELSFNAIQRSKDFQLKHLSRDLLELGR
ncbi:MAG: glycosyltransferase family 4 protein [Verrucomicrobiota bacterium]